MLIGLCLTLGALLLLPVIPAVQVQTVKQEQIAMIYEKIETTRQFSNLLNSGVFKEHSELISTVTLDDISHMIDTIWFESDNYLNPPTTDDPGDPEPVFFPFLGIFVYLAIAYVFIAINVMVLKFIGKHVRAVIDAIVSRIVQFLENVLTVIMFVLTLAYNIVKGLLTGLVIVGTFIIDVVLIIITGILTLIVLVLQGIINILATIWRGIGDILRFIIEMINVVIDALFPLIG